MADAKTEKQKVKEITDKLEEGLKELFEREKYKSYLSTMSKFHNYSFNNTLLINLQYPGATFVAGYKAWQTKFNRHIFWKICLSIRGYLEADVFLLADNAKAQRKEQNYE